MIQDCICDSETYVWREQHASPNSCSRCLRRRKCESDHEGMGSRHMASLFLFSASSAALCHLHFPLSISFLPPPSPCPPCFLRGAVFRPILYELYEISALQAANFSIIPLRFCCCISCYFELGTSMIELHKRWSYALAATIGPRESQPRFCQTRIVTCKLLDQKSEKMSEMSRTQVLGIFRTFFPLFGRSFCLAALSNQCPLQRWRLINGGAQQSH